MIETRRFHRKMITRELQIRDLAKIQKLMMKNLWITQYKVLASLIHFVFNLPLKSLGLDTIFGSITQTHDGKIVGLIITRRFPLAKIWVIGPIVVDRCYRGFGIGASIMELTLKLLQDKKAEGALISVDNSRRHSAARRLFQKFGFRVLKHTFTSSNQAYAYARMMSLIDSFYSRTQGSFSKEIDLRSSQRIWYIFSREF